MIATRSIEDAPPVIGKLEAQRRGTWRENWMTSPADRQAIAYLLNSIEPRIMIEIGVNLGYTAKMILENVPSIKKYIGIDLVDMTRTAPERPGMMALDDPRFTTALFLRGSFDLKTLDDCDVVFIDGDHGFEAVMHDTALAVDCGAMMILWHDYRLDEVNDVTRALDEMMHVEGSPIVHVAGTWLAYCDLRR